MKLRNLTNAICTSARSFYVFVLVAGLVSCGPQQESAKVNTINDTVKIKPSPDPPVIARKVHTADEDSIRKDHGMEEDITLIAKRYIDGEAQYAFLIHNSRADRYASFSSIFDFDKTDEEQYRQIYTSQKAKADSVIDIQQEFPHLVKKWVPVYLYNDAFHAFRTCGFPRRWALTDSTFINYYMDGPSVNLIKRIEQVDKRYEVFLSGNNGKIILEQVDSVNNVYMLTASGRSNYFVTPLENITRFPLIVEHCTEDGVSPLVDFKNTLPSGNN